MNVVFTALKSIIIRNRVFTPGQKSTMIKDTLAQSLKARGIASNITNVDGSAIEVTSITLAPTTASGKVGDKITVTATALPSLSNLDITVTSGTPTNATVVKKTANTFEITCVAVGTSTITVSTTGQTPAVTKTIVATVTE